MPLAAGRWRTGSEHRLVERDQTARREVASSRHPIPFHVPEPFRAAAYVGPVAAFMICPAGPGRPGSDILGGISPGRGNVDRTAV